MNETKWTPTEWGPEVSKKPIFFGLTASETS
jgi:hypothetical protein